MAKWFLIIVLLATVVCHFKAEFSHHINTPNPFDYNCTTNRKCEHLCGVGQGWCLGGWCACVRKRDIHSASFCGRDEDCLIMGCSSTIFTPRCFSGQCLCIPELGK